jgi:hypothetical protein
MRPRKLIKDIYKKSAFSAFLHLKIGLYFKFFFGAF